MLTGDPSLSDPGLRAVVSPWGQGTPSSSGGQRGSVRSEGGRPLSSRVHDPNLRTPSGTRAWRGVLFPLSPSRTVHVASVAPGRPLWSPGAGGLPGPTWGMSAAVSRLTLSCPPATVWDTLPAKSQAVRRSGPPCRLPSLSQLHAAVGPEREPCKNKRTSVWGPGLQEAAPAAGMGPAFGHPGPTPRHTHWGAIPRTWGLCPRCLVCGGFAL